MAHVDDQRVARVLDALEAQHPGAQLLVNDPWSIYYLTGFYADMFERFCGVLLARGSEPVILVNALHQLPEYDNARVAYHTDTDVVADAIVREVNPSKPLGIDTVISPKDVTASQISSYVRGLANSQGSAVESLHYILGGAIEAVEFTATPATHFLDRPLSDLAFRKGLLVAAIVHEGKMQIPNGQSQIRAGDRVIVMAQELFLQDLNDILG